MIWELVFGLIVVVVLFDLWIIIRGKPTRKSAFKRLVNDQIALVGLGVPFIIIMGLMLAYVGSVELADSSDVDVVVISWGLNLTITLVTIAMIIFWCLDLINSLKNHKQLSSYKWLDKINADGFFKYTDEEKAFNKKNTEDFNNKMKRYFPFLAKVSKKENKDAI